MTTEQIKYPPYVTSKQGQILFRFLSVLADHFDKNIFWIKSQFGLYKQKFGMIPNNYLVKTLNKYLIDELKWLPTVATVGQYVFGRPDFQTHWHTIPIDKVYCVHCRTDEIGKEGGKREVFYYGYRQSKNKIAEAYEIGNCDCELAKMQNGMSYIDVMEWMQNQDPSAEIYYSYYDHDTNRKVHAYPQSRRYWDKKVEYGIFTRDGDHLIPNYDHPMWLDRAFSPAMHEIYGIEMPEHIAEKIKMQRDQKVGRKWEKNRRLKRDIANDPYEYDPPKSLAHLLLKQ